MRTFLLGVLLLFGGRAVVGAHHRACASSVSVNMLSQTVSTEKAMAAIRAARPSLNHQLNQDYSISDYYGFYFDAELTVEYLGMIDGKEWYRVSYGGGDVIADLEDFG